MINNSCINCSDRYLGCHDKCESYRQYKVQLNDIRKENNNDRELVRDQRKRQLKEKYSRGIR